MSKESIDESKAYMAGFLVGVIVTSVIILTVSVILILLRCQL